MRTRLILLLVLLSAGPAAAADASHYYVPPGQFTASLQAMKLGLANITALFGNATGSFNYDAQTKTLSNLRLAVDMSSIVSNTSDNQNGLSTLLGTSQYPEMRFTALDGATFADGKASIKGTLTVHGTSKPATFEAVLNIGSPALRDSNAWASQSEPLGLSLHGSFRRAEFGMTDDPETPALFGDTVALQLEMQAIRQ